MHDEVYTAVKYNTNCLVFKNLGVMLHGKTKHFANITTIIKVYCIHLPAVILENDVHTNDLEFS